VLTTATFLVVIL